MLKTGISKLQVKEGHALQLRRPDGFQMELRLLIELLQTHRIHKLGEPQIEHQPVHQHQIGQHQIGQLHQVHLIGLLGQDQWAHHVLLQVQVVHLQVQVVHLVRVQPGLEVEDDIDFFTY